MMASQTWVWLVVGLLAAGLIGSLEANEFKVGGKQGWVSNPSENYGQWSSRLRFQVNDTLFFKYNKGSDSVLVVSKQDYDACNTENPITKLDGGDSVFKIDRSGPHYFISGNKSNCEKGQKLSVVVLAVRKKQLKSPPLPSPSPSPAAGPPASSPVSPSPAAKTPATSPTPASSPLVPSLPPSVSPTPAITPLSPNLAPSPAATTPARSPTPISSPFSPSPAPSVSPTPSITPSSPTPAITPATTPSPSPVTSSTPGISPVSPTPGNTAGITPSSSEISPTTPPAPNSSAPAFTPSVVLVLGLWLGSFVAAGAPRKNMYNF